MTDDFHFTVIGKKNKFALATNGNGTNDNPGIYSVVLDPEEIIDSELIFKPTQVPSYTSYYCFHSTKTLSKFLIR